MPQPMQQTSTQSPRVGSRPLEDDPQFSADRDIADKTSLRSYLEDYTRHNPGTVALWCLVVGFVLGWKLKPW